VVVWWLSGVLACMHAPFSHVQTRLTPPTHTCVCIYKQRVSFPTGGGLGLDDVHLPHHLLLHEGLVLFLAYCFGFLSGMCVDVWMWMWMSTV
jgi:hypothetical protein